jgi:hypothetical protein
VIEISRKQIFLARSIFRQALGLTSTRRAPNVTFQATVNELSICVATDNVAIEMKVEGDFASLSFAIPYESLTACEGRDDGTVRFELVDDVINLRWFDADIPQSAQYGMLETHFLPTLPVDLVSIDRQFLRAMADACETTDSSSFRYALNCVRLRGSDGQIAATDGQQALIQTGFHFPWTDDVVIPSTGAFAAKAVLELQSVSIGRSKEWMFIRADNWTVALKLETERRFPSLDSQISEVSAASTTMVLGEEDAEFLARAANRLPAADETNSPVTLDLNGSVVVRAQSADQQLPTDLVLRNSQRRGSELKVCSNREFLKRAVRLGFREIHFRNGDDPAFCRDDRRVYLWMLLGKDAVLKPDESAVRIESPVLGQTIRRSRPKQSLTQSASTVLSRSPKNRIPMTSSQTRQSDSVPATGQQKGVQSLSELIDAGVILRTTLRDLLVKTTELISGLKRQRQQSTLMQAALKSLRAVQAIEH